MGNDLKHDTQLRFEDLWKNYPSNDPCVNPRTGKKAYDNQCAIRLGMALQKCGVSFKTFKGPRCEFGPPGNGMALRAQELADWLRMRPFVGCPYPHIQSGKDFGKFLRGRTGIVFFKDYWFREGERLPTGDHVDLWHIDRMTPSLSNFLRFSVGLSSVRIPGLPISYSNLSNARQVWFWQIV